MLLKDLIEELQKLRERELKLTLAEPEIVIHMYRQVDSIGNFEYAGTSRNIVIDTPGKNKPFVLSGDDDFETTASHFPEDILEVDAKFDFRYQISLMSDFPRAKANIESLWGTQRGRDCIVGLVVDDRPGRYNSRVKGFPPEIYTCINNLLAIHDRIFPKFIPPTKPWDIKI